MVGNDAMDVAPATAAVVVAVDIEDDNNTGVDAVMEVDIGDEVVVVVVVVASNMPNTEAILHHSLPLLHHH